MPPDESYRGDNEHDDDGPERSGQHRPPSRHHRAEKADTSWDDDGESKHRHKSGDTSKKTKRKPSFFQRPAFKIGAAVVLVIAIIAGITWWLIERHYETTDDAFIDTHIVLIAPQISGQVREVHVTDNQQVHVGDPLIDIDSADAQARLDQATAQETQAETQYHQAQAAAEGAEAQRQNAESELARYRVLQQIMPAAVAKQQIDEAQATAKNATAQRDAARAQIAGAEAQIRVTKAQISAAQLTFGYTKIVAPAEGHIAQKTVAVGNFVSPGQEMLAIVPLQVWVTANFKETQLTDMRVGQKVEVGIDACGDVKAHGHVDSIQRGAGQAFGILPPENATGNYVKVVQRVPVKIVLDDVPQNCVLGPGMSVEPQVTVR